MQNEFDIEFNALKIASKKLGINPMLIQAAGGNTSIKNGDIMWIKASGTVLSDAMSHAIFVPARLDAMRKAVLSSDPSADQPMEFIADPSYTLRPSIETSLHAVFTQSIVLHVHCVHTLAIAIRQDGEAILRKQAQRF